MAKKFLATCFWLLLLVLVPALPLSAADLAVTGKAGTLGLGVELTLKLRDRVNLRGGLNAYELSRSMTESGIRYDGDLELQSLGLLVDLHPLGGRFRVSGGVLSNGNQFDLTATPASDVEIGGVTYTPSQVGTIHSVIDFDSLAPYAGVGFGNATGRKGRLSFAFDVGVMFQGSPRARITATGSAVDPDDLRREEQELQDDVDSFEYWPVISAGVAYRF